MSQGALPVELLPFGVNGQDLIQVEDGTIPAAVLQVFRGLLPVPVRHGKRVRAPKITGSDPFFGLHFPNPEARSATSQTAAIRAELHSYSMQHVRLKTKHLVTRS